MAVYGVPELVSDNQNEIHEHDMEQWCWLPLIIGLHTTTMVSVYRLVHLKHLIIRKFALLITVDFRSRENVTDMP